MTDSRCPEDTLQKIVEIVAGKFNTDVCSIYLFDAGKNNLVLKATVGLSKESVNRISMNIHEGLTGLVLETMGPVFVVNPSRHPRYKFFEGSGEEAYKTFLGVPLVYHKEILGVLVVQTLRETDISESDIKVASLYNPLHPAVISTILEVVSSCKANNKSVSICGEAASSPKCAYLFLAMGTDQLSMNAASVPIIKNLVRSVRLTDAKKALGMVLRMEDAEEIAAFLEGLVAA